MLQLLPMQQITTDRMPPSHLAPHGRVRIVLKKQVPDAIAEHQSVGIIQPIFCCGEVKLWPVQLCIWSGHGSSRFLAVRAPSRVSMQTIIFLSHSARARTYPLARP